MIKILQDLEAVSIGGAVLFVQLCADAIASRGRFDVALSGGSTPKKMFELLAGDAYRDKVDWSCVHAFWSDERYVPPTQDASNERMARLSLLDHVPIPAGNIHGMYRVGGVGAAADAYEDLVRDELGPDLAFDLTLLGLGPDGHTASLFPGEPDVNEQTRLVLAGIGHAGVAERITMTPPLLNRSRTVAFLVAGADKAEPVRRVLEGPEDWAQTPAQAVARHAEHVVWLIDLAAAALLSG